MLNIKRLKRQQKHEKINEIIETTFKNPKLL